MTEVNNIIQVKRNAIGFLDQYPSENTIYHYNLIFRDYLSCINDIPHDKDGKLGIIRADLSRVANEYFSIRRDFRADVERYFASIKNRPPITIRTYLAVVRVFLRENDVELGELFWKRLNKKIKGNRPLTLDLVPTNKELQTMLSDMPLHGKALFLFLATSGCRIGETLQLSISDINFKTDPVQINISGRLTKTGNSRITFITSECAEMIKEWLATRPQFIEHRGMPVNDTRLFPFDNHVASLMFANGLKRAGLVERDSSTNRYRVHIHVLRKFFRTRLGAVMNSDFTEALIGHEDHLKEVYARYSIEDIAKEYKKSEHALAVFPNDTTVKTLTEDVTMLKGIVAKFFQIGENAQKIMK